MKLTKKNILFSFMIFFAIPIAIKGQEKEKNPNYVPQKNRIQVILGPSLSPEELACVAGALNNVGVNLGKHLGEHLNDPAQNLGKNAGENLGKSLEKVCLMAGGAVVAGMGASLIKDQVNNEKWGGTIIGIGVTLAGLLFSINSPKFI